jgi:hypothetical protein
MSNLENKELKGYIWKPKTVSNKNIENIVTIYGIGETAENAKYNIISNILNKLKSGLICFAKLGYGKPLEIIPLQYAEDKNLEYYTINIDFITYIINTEPDLLENNKYQGKRLNPKAKPFVIKKRDF